MDAEARPIRQVLAANSPPRQLHPAFPATITCASNGRVAVVSNGQDPRFGVDSIASQPAVVSTLHGAEDFQPTLVLSAGTAGGFSQRGSSIGDIVVADRVVFHDRRVSIPGFDRYGIGDYPLRDLSQPLANLAESWSGPYAVRSGTVSTGNALDAPEVDLEAMTATGTMAKDMEAAAVAWVCERLGVDFGAIKAITDLVDSTEPTGEQFSRNLKLATRNLAETLGRLIPLLV